MLLNETVFWTNWLSDSVKLFSDLFIVTYNHIHSAYWHNLYSQSGTIKIRTCMVNVFKVCCNVFPLFVDILWQELYSASRHRNCGVHFFTSSNWELFPKQWSQTSCTVSFLWLRKFLWGNIHWIGDHIFLVWSSHFLKN